jgi:CrcB protein
MQAVLLVFLGGGLGAAVRHLVNLGAGRFLGIAFPWGTFGVNITGSFLMGLLVAWLATKYEGGGQDLRLFLATGVLGGYTTFSSFSLDAVALWERGAQVAAAAYIIGSVVLSIAALAAALAIGRSWG